MGHFYFKYSPPGSFVHINVILQARIPEWVAIPFSRDLLDPGFEPMVPTSPALAGKFFTTSATREALYYYIYIYIYIRLAKKFVWILWTTLN